MPTNTDVQKSRMIDAMEKSLGIVTTACKTVGINRSTHYDWMEKDANYKKAIESIQDVVLDFAESQLHKQVKEGNSTSTIFFLKTKGKKRGYVERSESISHVKVSTTKLTDQDIQKLTSLDDV